MESSNTPESSPKPQTPTPTGPDVDRLMVPEEMLQKLHDARQKFHDANEKLKAAMDSTDYDHTQHVNERYGDLRKMEEEVEKLTEKVQEILGRKV